MKAAFLFFCVALATATADHHLESRDADHDFLVKQKNVFQLLYHMHQPNIHEEQLKHSKEFSLEENTDHFTNATVVKQFLHKYKHEGYLKKGGIFAVSDENQVAEVEHLFSLFYHAKDYDTFFKTACWAREHINEQMFVYAFSVAVIHRPDCKGIILPPPYEIFPYYFINQEYIQDAYEMKMQGYAFEDNSHVTYNEDSRTATIKSNYSGWYVRWNDEQKLSYFTEDVGLNSFYYYFHLDYPFWMDGEEYHISKDRRGEIFYYLHKQLLARYYMERLSNGLGEIPEFSWHLPIEEGYYPSLQYHNGLEFPSRPNNFNFHQHEFLNHLIQVEDYERRIRDGIDHGYLIAHDGKHVPLTKYEHVDQLANVVESNKDVPCEQFYKNLQFVARMLLGNSVKPRNWHALAPSALEHYQTSLRDPAFYQLFKRYMGFFTQFQNNLHPYTKEELMCPGVTIENVEVEKLVTYFDHFEVDITNAVHQNKEERQKAEDNMFYKVRQHRLNHKPFTVTTNLVAEKASKVVVKFFLGPKYDSHGHTMTLEENRHNFFELDQFTYDLKAGKNTIQRNSREFVWNTKDWTPSHQLYQEMVGALDGKNKFPLDMSEAHNGFPDRLIIPKGWYGGMPAHLYVFVYPYEAPAVPWGTGFDHVITSGVGSGARYLDNKPLGYPFNLPIVDTFQQLPNMHFEDVLIFHKRETEVNQAN